MKVYLIQFDARPAETEQNLDKIAFMMKGVEPGSMVFCRRCSTLHMCFQLKHLLVKLSKIQ